MEKVLKHVTHKNNLLQKKKQYKNIVSQESYKNSCKT